jgi:GNAT superfamily N-acetyltransferase
VVCQGQHTEPPGLRDTARVASPGSDPAANARVEVRADGALSDGERALIARRRAAVDYGMPAWGYAYAPKEWRALAWVGDDLAGHAGIVRRAMRVGGMPLAVGGLSGVWTPAEWRGRGFGAAVVRAAAAFVRDELGADFGLLLCREAVAPFYQRLGWRPVAGPVVFDQPGGRVTWGMTCLVLPCGPADWPAGEIDLCGLPW